MATRAAQAACDDAYALHDAIYATQEAQDAAMEAAQARALAAVDAAEAAAETQQKDTALLARLRYLRGKACASTADGQGSAEAETLLADAVKLDPLLVDAWNCLGECFWARGEFPLAMHTLKGALAHRRDPATLCKLSQLLRAMGAREAQKGDAQQKEKLLVEARKMAKEARARARRATRRPAQLVAPRNSSARALRRPAQFGARSPPTPPSPSPSPRRRSGWRRRRSCAGSTSASATSRSTATSRPRPTT